MCSTMAMYSELTIENFNKIKQALLKNEDEILKLYPYLSQNKILSQDEHETEAKNVMERIKDQVHHQIHHQVSNGKFNEITPQENIQEGLRFINIVNEIYILYQQEKKILHDENESIQQLQLAEEKLQQAKKQLQQANEQLQQAKKQLKPTQEKLKLINQQEILFNSAFKQNKEIVMQKLKTE